MYGPRLQAELAAQDIWLLAFVMVVNLVIRACQRQNFNYSGFFTIMWRPDFVRHELIVRWRWQAGRNIGLLYCCQTSVRRAFTIVGQTAPPPTSQRDHDVLARRDMAVKRMPTARRWRRPVDGRRDVRSLS
jgi:hypothetical protein